MAIADLVCICGGREYTHVLCPFVLVMSQHQVIFPLLWPYLYLYECLVLCNTSRDNLYHRNPVIEIIEQLKQLVASI